MRIQSIATLIAVSILIPVQPAKSGEKDHVAALLEDARQDLPKIDDITRRIRIGLMLATCSSRYGDKAAATIDFAKCIELANTIQGPNEPDSTLSWIATSQANAGDFKAADRTLKQVRVEAFRLECVGDLTAAATRQRNLQKALEYAGLLAEPEGRDELRNGIATAFAAQYDFERARIAAKSIESAEHRRSVVYSISFYAASAGDLPLAIETANALADSPALGELWLRICEARARAGNLFEARRDFDRAHALLVKHQGLNGRSLAGMLAKLGDFDEAIRRFRASEKTNNGILVDIVEALAARGQWDRALALSRECQSARSRGYAFMKIATAQEKAGDLAGARQTLVDLTVDPELHKMDLLSIARQQHRLGDTNRAKFRIQEAVKYVQNARLGPKISMIRFCEIAQAQAELGYSSGAAATFRLAREVALLEPGQGAGAMLIAENVAGLQAKWIGLGEITKWINESPVPSIRATARIAIARALLDQRK